MDSASSQGMQGPTGGGNPVAGQQGPSQPGAQGQAFNDALSFLRDYLLQSTMALLEKKRKRELMDANTLTNGADMLFGMQGVRPAVTTPDPGMRGRFMAPSVDPRFEQRGTISSPENPYSVTPWRGM